MRRKKHGRPWYISSSWVQSSLTYPNLWLLEVRPAAQVSTYVYVNPVVAVLLGAIIINEQITWLQIAGLIIILSGVLMVNIAKYKGAIQKV